MTCSVVKQTATHDVGREVFKTQAVSGSDTPTWNHSHVCEDYMTDDMFVFRCWRKRVDGNDEKIGQVTLLYMQFKDGFEGSVGMLTELEEITRPAGGAVQRGF